MKNFLKKNINNLLRSVQDSICVIIGKVINNVEVRMEDGLQGSMLLTTSMLRQIVYNTLSLCKNLTTCCGIITTNCF